MSFCLKNLKSKDSPFSLVLSLADNLPVSYADDNFYNFIEYSKEDFKTDLDNQFLFLIHQFDIVHLKEVLFSKDSFDGQEVNIHCTLTTKNNNSKFVHLSIKYGLNEENNIILKTTVYDISDTVMSYNMPSIFNNYYNFLDKLTDSYYFNIDLLNETFTSSEKFANLISMPKTTFLFPDDFINKNMITKEDITHIFNNENKPDTVYYGEFRLKTSLEEKVFLMRYKVVYCEETPNHILGKLTDITGQSLNLNTIPNEKKFDKLTLLYNKNIAYDLIRNSLTSKTANQTSALILVDLRGFNYINDTLGNLYGDAVLSEYAKLLKNTFREIDIISRIGGDDFLIFMKDYNSDSLLIQKLEKIHNLFSSPYVDNSREIKVSADIGVAISSNESSLRSLLNKSSLALENSKNDDDIFYTLYNDNQEDTEFKTNLSPINSFKSNQENFSENMSSYVFNLLYKSANFESAIQSVLHLINDHFNFSSSFITEFSDDSRFLNTNYSFSPNNKTLSHLLKNTSVTDFLFITVPIINSGSLIIDSHSETDEGIIAILNENSVRSLISFSLIDDGNTIGFISFTTDEAIRFFTDEQFNKLESAAKVISVFLAKNRYKTLNHKNFLDNLKS